MIIKNYGACSVGEVYSITLVAKSGVEVEILSLGATIRSILVPDKSRNKLDVCLGYDTPEEYLTNDAYFGACIGRSANRIGKARFSIDGVEYNVSENKNGFQLHGGFSGFSMKNWTFWAEESSVTFYLNSPHLDEGFPGNLQVAVKYSLDEDGELTISYRAETDRPTVVNLTNHSYFNLAGHDSGRIDEHYLTSNAEYYTLCDENIIPTGEFKRVEGTALDFSTPKKIGESINDASLASTFGLDQNLVLNKQSNAPDALLYCEKSGIALEVRTSLPGLQVYSSGCLPTHLGKNGAEYGFAHALCLETQQLPDAVNHPEFPTSVIRENAPFAHWSKYKFYVK